MKIFVTAFFLGVLFLACGEVANNPEARVSRLGHQIRCPVCRGVPIAESPAALAVEMMELLREQVAAGKSDEEVLRFFEERYGEWVLLKPKREGMNLIVWILPAVVLVGGALFIIVRTFPPSPRGRGKGEGERRD